MDVNSVERKSVIIQEKVTMTITESGKSKDDAVGKIFSKLRKKMYSEVPGPIIQMEPDEVFIDNIEVKKYTERFLFLFMPREKEEIKLTATIVVNVKYLKMEG